MAAPPTPVDLEAAIREALEGAALEDITQRSLRTTVRSNLGAVAYACLLWTEKEQSLAR